MNRHHIRIIVLLSALLLTAGNGWAQDTTYISGSQSGSLGPGIYSVTSGIWIAQGENLTIAAGTHLVFGGDFGLTVHGELHTNSGGDGVVFKRDNGVSAWSGITFSSTASPNSELFDCEIYGCNSSAVHLEYVGITILGGSIHDNSMIGGGGGIYVNDCDPEITNCDFYNNTCTGNGGAIVLNSSNAEITGCTISGNEAGAHGGGIWAYLSNFLLDACDISDNISRQCGGGLYLIQSSPDIQGSDFTGNLANDYGGGIAVISGSHPTFDGSALNSIWQNYAGCGSDLYADEGISLTVPLDIFTVATPAAFHAYPLADITVTLQAYAVDQVNDNLFVSPTGDDSNDGLSAGSPLKTISYALSKMLADDGNEHTITLLGGDYDIAVSGQIYPLNMVGYTSLVGSDTDQPAILDAEEEFTVMYLYDDPSVVVQNVEITNGKGYIWAGVNAYQSDAIFEDCLVDANGGYGLYFIQSSPEITNCTISNNLWSGLYFEQDCFPTVTECLIEGNLGAPWGGGIYMAISCAGAIFDCEIRNNQADSDGGGIYLDDTCSPNIEQCDIHDNQCYEAGGGICIRNGSHPWIYQTRIEDNSALYWTGGGLSIDLGSNPLVERCLIAGNYSLEGGGITIGAIEEASPNIVHCTVAHNEAPSANGLLVSNNSQPTVVNTMFEAFDQASFVVKLDGSADLSLTYCNIYNTQDSYLIAGGSMPVGMGELVGLNLNGDSTDTYMNVYSDPVMVDPDNDNYYLAAGSACINAGDPSLPADPDNSIADIGCFYLGEVGVQDPNPDIVPAVYALGQNYPNPFNPVTTIDFQLRSAGLMALTVYNLKGERVATLVDGWRAAGYHCVDFDAYGLASGMYLYRMVAGDFEACAKMVLMK